jgi:DUF1680 family protein
MSTTRRHFIGAAALGGLGTAVAPIIPTARVAEPAAKSGAAVIPPSDAIIKTDDRFAYFQSKPVSYLHVKMQDALWAPRQKTIHDVTLPWTTRHYDDAGGLEACRAQPETYKAETRIGDLESIKFIEAMASAFGLQRDSAIEGLIDSWGKRLIDGQAADGYSAFGYPFGADPERRWQAVWYSHEDYALGHYLESAIAYWEVTGKDAMYKSAVRAVDNMAAEFLGSQRAYVPGHAEIEQALMRLYGLTGSTKYLQLCGWLIGQRGRREGRRSYGKYSQDHVPIKEQRTIEGHAVRAAFLFNGVTEYVGATGDAAYRQAALAIWDDLVDRKMYIHGASGNQSTKNEGYSTKPYFIPPDDTYGESCAAFGNFQWAHNLFRLTGDARYLDTAERILYNVFYASLSMQGDRFFYRNVSQIDQPILRYEWHTVPCCPPNIVKLFCKVGGFFYSIDDDGIFVKHYGASVANIPFRNGVKLIQRGTYPWSGDITVQVEPKIPAEFTLRLRVPSWAKSHALKVNGKTVASDVRKGWVAIHRPWVAGDSVEVSLPMTVERVTMPSEFKDYRNLAALKRGPIVYCIEQQDSSVALPFLILPEDAKLTSEYRSDLLGGVTVLRGTLPRQSFTAPGAPVPVTFVPYGVWNNRGPDLMQIWLTNRARTLEEVLADFEVAPSME